jgi:hypothetical protein
MPAQCFALRINFAKCDAFLKVNALAGLDLPESPGAQSGHRQPHHHSSAAKRCQPVPLVPPPEWTAPAGQKRQRPWVMTQSPQARGPLSAYEKDIQSGVTMTRHPG